MCVAMEDAPTSISHYSLSCGSDIHHSASMVASLKKSGIEYCRNPSPCVCYQSSLKVANSCRILEMFQIVGPPTDVPTASKRPSGLQASDQITPCSS